MSSSITLEPVDLDRCNWQQLDALPDRVVFQTREWISFVAETQGATPIVAAILRDGEPVGFFTGLVVRRYGVRILGSPFPGWTTSYQGFNLLPGVSRREVTDALRSFAWKELGCLHLELTDRSFGEHELDGLGFTLGRKTTFEVPLEPDEDEILGRMTSACRRCIRKAAKEGVVVEEAGEPGFADEYYAQLEEVFARKSRRPTYDIGRVRALIKHVHPTGRLLLLRARGPAGNVIATGIFPAMNGRAYFWGGASWREYQIHRPNEALMWHAMQYWKQRGVRAMDMGGSGDYKLKYGPDVFYVPYFRVSRLPVIPALRNGARRLLAKK